ncbi:MAG: N-acetylmuramoyl-L-alanine amidase-like domain-containing protein [Gemmatimonadales bacterium]
MTSPHRKHPVPAGLPIRALVPARRALGAMTVAAALLACRPEAAPGQGTAGSAGSRPSAAEPAGGGTPVDAAVAGADRAAAAWSDADWKIFSDKVRWGAGAGLDTLDFGAAVARLGRTFVGTTYTPGTLEVPGPERLVINLHELDCVTFVENMLALTRFIRRDGVAALADPAAARSRYEGYLREWRYRGGRLDGYPSRLHYFSEWLADNAARGRVALLARELGGVRDTEPITFMTSHRSAYRQLADSAVFAAIADRERILNADPGRWYLPKAAIAAAAAGIHDGDVIAATSTLPGLDVAHTGIALWVDGTLHLLHAPLVGKNVEISTLPLADRIRDIKSQDGIMVARPVDPDR